MGEIVGLELHYCYLPKIYTPRKHNGHSNADSDCSSNDSDHSNHKRKIIIRSNEF